MHRRDQFHNKLDRTTADNDRLICESPYSHSLSLVSKQRAVKRENKFIVSALPSLLIIKYEVNQCCFIFVECFCSICRSWKEEWQDVKDSQKSPQDEDDEGSLAVQKGIEDDEVLKIP
jgi:hypothetical protein